MASITLRQLEVFALIMEHGSFRACARQLGVSQVAISDHVRQLEERLGHQLFKRVRGGASILTPEGERAFLHATKILAARDGLIAEMKEPELAPTGRKLVISAHSDILRYFQEALGQFEDKHPQIAIELDLDTFTADAVEEKMQNCAVDIGFFYTLAPPPGMDSVLMWHEPLAFFVAQDHILAQQEQVTAADLSNFPLIRQGPHNRLRLLIDRAMELAGLGRCSVATETDNFGLMLTSLRNGQGFACMFESSAGALMRLGGIKRIDFGGHLVAIEVRRAIHPSWYSDPLIAELLAAL
ncbi:LysR family transcriptional regulator [Rhizorhapis sp.]|uniref:LysR family transcriptional regulator n=1 Tax=Rhizorhapis sp. TaxID=1968842 RepID=UPI002B49943F|nr:LysR family transcriptional regulator [Rhizorhapis sp.]HKR17558.1 LysR family transcriptional regulator [Rhizorhapis sp.]